MNSQSDEQVRSLQQLTQRLRAGTSIGAAWKAEQSSLERFPELRERVAKILKTASSLGAPVVPVIERLVHVEQHRQASQADLEAEFAAPKATARLVAWLPPSFLVFTQLMGLPILDVIWRSVVAKLAVGLGVGLLVFARVWSKRILKAAQPSQLDLTQGLELVVIALRAGLGFDAALQRVGAAVDTSQLLVQERLLARTTGAAIAGLVEARADSIRENQARADRVRIREASIKLMWPLGAAVLPALILMLVVPMTVGFGNIILAHDWALASLEI
jgi:tight adherence protein B